MMKNLFFGFAVVTMASFVLSCASTAPKTAGKEFTHEDALSAFEKIYDDFRDDIILEGAKTYVVVKGDMLSSITRAHYGTGNGYFFPLIMLASSDVVLDPELIEPGMNLTIPDLQKNLDNLKARDNVKRFLNEIADVYDRKGTAAVRYHETRDHLRTLAASL